MHLETLIDDLGSFGMYQMILIPTLSLAVLVLGPTMLMMAFAGVEPDWWCTSQHLLPSQWNVSYANGSYQHCLWNETCERRFSDDMETAVTEWNLVCQMSWVSNAIISIQMVGVLVGTVIAGYCADAYGRKKVFYSGLLLIFLGNTASAFSVSWVMFTVLRAVLGIACSFILSTTYLYQIEFVGKKWRALISSLPTWSVSIMMLSLLAKWLHNWKWLHLTTAALTFPILFTWFFVPESLRWLAVKGRLEEARCVINKMAAYNKKPVPDTAILELIAEEEKAEGDKAKSYTYIDLLKTKKLARKTIFSCYIWFSCSIVYYAISFGLKNLSGDFYLNMLLMALTELPITPCIILVTSLFGRRVCAAFAFLLTAAGCFGLAISTRLAPVEDKGNYINACALTAKCTTLLGWLVVQALCVEQYPTVIRNLGYAAMNSGARIGGILAGLVLSLGGSKDLMVPFIALGIVVCVTVLATLGLDETRGKALEDTMKTCTPETHEKGRLLLWEGQERSTVPCDDQPDRLAEKVVS
ncbi:organic cation transporter protein-like [Haliotis cracherodii]|uniref:organic cation transporter protein-like n=1 Tax=Haliotis cracherodii TaxID=6455 RepID=UPI0039ECA67C